VNRYREEITRATYVQREGEKPFNLEAVVTKEPELAQMFVEQHYHGRAVLSKWMPYEGEWVRAWFVTSPLDEPDFLQGIQWDEDEPE
jgi:hypothetical protein